MTDRNLSGGEALRTEPVAQTMKRALAHFHEGRLAESERLCRGVLRAHPDEPRALSLLGYLALRGDMPDVAIDCFRKAIALEPAHAGHRGVLATALRLVGRHEEALASQQACVELAPEDAGARQNLAAQYAETGQLNLARQTYEEALAVAPELSQAHYGLALIKKFRRGDPQIGQMIKALADEALSPADRSRIAFALGKACEDLGDYDEAFGYYALGNRIKKTLAPFDIGSERRNARRIIEAFTGKVLDDNRDGGFRSELPVFIVGMPRSGSSLVEQIIGSHPEVHGAGELPNLFRAIERGLQGRLPEGRELPEAVGQVPAQAWADLGESYVASVARLAPIARRIVDKQLFNYTLVGMIRLMLPEARIIHCLRDPMATCLSCFTHSFGADRGFTNDLTELGEAYRIYAELMDHWRDWLDAPMLEVRYEGLIAAPEQQARRLTEFLGLEWSDACLAFHRNPRPVITSSLGQVRAPLYASSLERWRRFEAHLGPLQEALSADA